MNIRNIDIRKFAFKFTYYLTTFIGLGLLVWALHHAYLYFNIASALWICLYIAIAVYLIFAIIVTTKRYGFQRFIAHTLMLQLVPIAASISIFGLISNDCTTFTPINGRASQYERAFNDLQDKQKAAAIANGLSPFKSRAEIEDSYKKLRLARKLVHIESNPKYIVRELTSSAPYVVPKVRDLLDDIATSFQEKTQSKARFIVTSVLRTEEDVAKLRKTNVNASTNSCHCNATTIDISYVRFGMDKFRPRDSYQLRLALAQTLHELRKEGRCYVKIERKQYCYHITVR